MVIATPDPQQRSPLPSLRHVLTGCALGDSWGRTLERKDYRDIVSVHGAHGPNLDTRSTLFITDDTQMSLYLARALSENGHAKPHVVQQAILDAWVTWESDPENFRAPGNTCLLAARRVRDGHPWHKATSYLSDGSGAVMRAWACAFIPEDRWASVAAWQAASTHAAAAAIVTSLLAADYVRNPPQHGESSIAYLMRRCTPVLIGKVDPYWFEGMRIDGSIHHYLESGIAVVQEALQTAESVANRPRDDPWADDPSAELPGWRSHHALACAAVCIDLFPDDPCSAVRRAVVTDGDSDTIGAVTGALCAARHPFPWKGVPDNWDASLERIYREWLSETDTYLLT